MLSQLHLHIACKSKSAARLASEARVLKPTRRQFALPSVAGGRGSNRLQRFLRDSGCECDPESLEPPKLRTAAASFLRFES